MEQRGHQTWNPAVGLTDGHAPARREKSVHLHVPNVLYIKGNNAGVNARKSKSLLLICPYLVEGPTLFCGAGLKPLFSVRFFSFTRVLYQTADCLETTALKLGEQTKK